MTNHPERIYNWLDSQLSIARFAGSISINGVTYVVAMHEEGQPLVRQDVLMAEAKKKERRNEQHTSTEDTEAMRLVSKRRKDMAAWAVENFKTWPKPHEITDADPEEIGCELVVLHQHHLPVLRCKLGGGYVDSTSWFYAKRNPKK